MRDKISVKTHEYFLDHFLRHLLFNRARSFHPEYKLVPCVCEIAEKADFAVACEHVVDFALVAGVAELLGFVSFDEAFFFEVV